MYVVGTGDTVFIVPIDYARNMAEELAELDYTKEQLQQEQEYSQYLELELNKTRELFQETDNQRISLLDQLEVQRKITANEIELRQHYETKYKKQKTKTWLYSGLAGLAGFGVGFSIKF